MSDRDNRTPRPRATSLVALTLEELDRQHHALSDVSSTRACSVASDVSLSLSLSLSLASQKGVKTPSFGSRFTEHPRPSLTNSQTNNPRSEVQGMSMSSLSRSFSASEVGSSSQTNKAEACFERTYLLYNIQLPLEMIPSGIRDFILKRFKAVRVGGYAQRTYTNLENQCVRLVLRSKSQTTLNNVQDLLVDHPHWTYRLLSDDNVTRSSDDLKNFQILPSASRRAEGGANSRNSKDYPAPGGSQKGGFPNIPSGKSSQRSSVKSLKIGSSSHGGSAAAAAERQDAERRVNAAQERVDAAQVRVDAAQVRVDAAQVRVKAAQNLVKAALKDVHEAELGFDAAADVLSAAQRELERAKQDQSCVVELKRLEAECIKLQVAHSSAKRLLSQAEESLSQAKESLSEEKESRSQAKESLSQAKESLSQAKEFLVHEERGFESALKYLETTQQLLIAITSKSYGLQTILPPI